MLVLVCLTNVYACVAAVGVVVDATQKKQNQVGHCDNKDSKAKAKARIALHGKHTRQE